MRPTNGCTCTVFVCTFVVAAVSLTVPRQALNIDQIAGVDGSNARVATFDTGIASHHSHFRSTKLKACEGFTTQPTCEDGFGHGSFVAGTIAAQDKRCPGIAPGVTLRTYKVFTDAQASYTSWFIDAVNHALEVDEDVVNLSVGGPDYYDRPFVDKIRETSAAGTTVVTAIGNDGPQFGTCYNPGDELHILAVGGHTAPPPQRIAGFSARGMTTWELPFGMGRPKPDVVTFGEALLGTNHRGGCKTLSGTSVAAPVVTGVLALVVDKLRQRGIRPNPALLKQLLVETATPLHTTCKPCPADMFPIPTTNAPVAQRLSDVLPAILVSPVHIDDALEMSVTVQGAGSVNAVKAVELAGSLSPAAASHRVSLHPAAFDLRAPCRHMWPYCDVPLFHTSQPLVANVTVLNAGASNFGIAGANGSMALVPATVVIHDGPRDLLNVSFASERWHWPWTGAVAIAFAVASDVPAMTVVRGTVLLRCVQLHALTPGRERQASAPRKRTTVTVEWPFAVTIRPKPPRERRLLWDTLHNLQYPPSFLPRDDLDEQADVLDWHGDHPFLNYRVAYQTLQRAGYAVEIPMFPQRGLLDVRLSDYGVLFVLEPEDYFFVEELEHIRRAVTRGLRLVVIGDWFDVKTIQSLGFVDDNTGSYWEPATGGANIPAINELLGAFGMEVSSTIWAGAFMHTQSRNARQYKFKSGNSILRVGDGSTVCSIARLRDQSSAHREAQEIPTEGGVPVLAVTPAGTGRVAYYADSGCLDGTHQDRAEYCMDLLLRVVASTAPDASAATLLHHGDMSCTTKPLDFAAKGRPITASEVAFAARALANASRALAHNNTMPDRVDYWRPARTFHTPVPPRRGHFRRWNPTEDCGE